MSAPNPFLLRGEARLRVHAHQGVTCTERQELQGLARSLQALGSFLMVTGVTGVAWCVSCLAFPRH